MTAAIRLATVATMVAVLLGVAGPRSQVEAAGDPLYVVSITQFCRGKIWGSAESASVKFAIALTNTGPRDVKGTLRASTVAMAPAVDPYQQLSTDGTVLLRPGETVEFVALGTGLNLARTTRFSAGVGNVYAVTDWYASPDAIPAC
jgi:hypothetical protein